MRFTDRQQALVDELLQVDDVHERLAFITDRARRAPMFSLTDRTPTHRVPGCASNVWLLGEERDGRCTFRADADSPVVRGLVVFLAQFYSGESARDIGANESDPIAALDLGRLLSPTRRHGLTAVRAAIRALAQNLPPARDPVRATAS